MRKRNARVYGCIAVVSAIVTGCSSSTGTQAAAPITKTVTATVTETATAANSATSPTAGRPAGTASARARSQALETGQEYTIPGDGTQATVMGFERGSSSHAEKGMIYDALEVKVCAASHATTVGDAPWSLIGADDSTNDDVVTGGGLKEPQYIDGNPLNQGDCALGWITFDVPQSEHIVAAKYAPSGPHGKPLPYAKWTVR